MQLGLKLFGQEKAHLLKEIGVDLKELYTHSKLADSNASNEDLNWEGAIEVDIVIYSTMKGVIELNQKGETYYLQSKLTTPHGVATLTDEFHYTVSNIAQNISSSYQSKFIALIFSFISF